MLEKGGDVNVKVNQRGLVPVLPCRAQRWRVTALSFDSRIWAQASRPAAELSLSSRVSKYSALLSTDLAEQTVRLMLPQGVLSVAV